jgi:ribulose-5-phosphate 4-epimerase/fuculose-1-phosphate aldolase
MESQARELAALCKGAAAHRGWVQAAGGNGSVKDVGSDRLWIKASGFRMEEVGPGGTEGQVALRLSQARQMVDERRYLGLPAGAMQDRARQDLAQAALPGQTLRPSLETGFHALGGRVVLHTHPESVLAFLCLRDGKARLESLIDEPFAWVPYTHPGHSLACYVADAARDRPEARIFFMKNHGLIVNADSGEEALALTEQIITRCQEAWGPVAPSVSGIPMAEVPPSLLGRAKSAWGPGAACAFSRDPWLWSPLRGPVASWQALCPDDPIYSGPEVPLLEGAEDVERYLERRLASGADKVAARLRGQGCFLAARTARAQRFMEEMLHANAVARALAQGREGFEPLSAGQCAELLGMEGERYRQGLAG